MQSWLMFKNLLPWTPLKSLATAVEHARLAVLQHKQQPSRLVTLNLADCQMGSLYRHEPLLCAVKAVGYLQLATRT